MHKVLIIDDEKDICFLISEILKDEKYITTSALNSDEAIKKFSENKPDLIILDVWLSNSKMDGIELLKEFKNLDENSKIKIVEVLWNIIYSDNNPDVYENSLMRRLTGLLYLNPKIVGDLKKKVKNNLK